MAHVDFKVTAWERVNIKEEHLETVIALIKSGDIQTSNDLVDSEYVEDSGEYQMIPETEQTLTLQENEGFSTIEVLNDEDETIYQNGK